MRLKGSKSAQQGIGLIEVTIALLIFLIALLTLAQAITLAIALNRKNRELLIANTLCKDKIEQLLSLDFDDIKTDTTVDPSGSPTLRYPTTGVGLSDGGSITPDPTVPFFFDNIDAVGQRVSSTSTNRIVFTRQWAIDTMGTYKRIRVTVSGPSTFGLVTEASMVAFKSQSQ